VEWVPVQSRMLTAVAYSEDWQQLYLKFRSSEVYCYRGVPGETVIGRKSLTIVAACLACTRPTSTPWSQSRRTIETDMRI